MRLRLLLLVRVEQPEIVVTVGSQWWQMGEEVGLDWSWTTTAAMNNRMGSVGIELWAAEGSID